MKLSAYFEDGGQQIMLKPENEAEQVMLRTLMPKGTRLVVDHVSGIFTKRIGGFYMADDNTPCAVLRPLKASDGDGPPISASAPAAKEGP